MSHDPALATLTLKPGQSAMFGYGSLLSRPSMERTFGGIYGGPIIPCAVRGWRRSWDIIMPNKNFYEARTDGEWTPQNIIYLNLRQDADTTVNGLLYVTEPHELTLFDQREWIYDRVDITDALAGARIEGGRAYAYVAKTEWIMPSGATRDHSALRQTYLDIVEHGLQGLGGDFRRAYEGSTDPVPLAHVFQDKIRA